MSDIPTNVLENRARWLGELAYAGGDKALQAGWAEYVVAERAKLDALLPDASKIAFARFKELGGAA